MRANKKIYWENPKFTPLRIYSAVAIFTQEYTKKGNLYSIPCNSFDMDRIFRQFDHDFNGTPTVCMRMVKETLVGKLIIFNYQQGKIEDVSKNGISIRV